jgi:hypothetical protein
MGGKKIMISTVEKSDMGYTDRVYDSRLEEKAREIVRLESKLAYANQRIEDLQQQLEEFYNE